MPFKRNKSLAGTAVPKKKQYYQTCYVNINGVNIKQYYIKHY